MNDEDVGRAGRDTRDINEVDVVLGKGHDGGIVTSVRRSLDVIPAKSRASSSSQRAHVEVE